MIHVLQVFMVSRHLAVAGLVDTPFTCYSCPGFSPHQSWELLSVLSVDIFLFFFQCDLLSSQKFLLVTLDPKTMTTTCVGSQLGLQFLHHKPSDDKDVHNVSAILKQFLSG